MDMSDQKGNAKEKNIIYEASVETWSPPVTFSNWCNAKGAPESYELPGVVII